MILVCNTAIVTIIVIQNANIIFIRIYKYTNKIH